MKFVNVLMIALLSLLLSSNVFSQDEKEEEKFGWLNAVVGTFGFTQTNLSNWQQGGEDSWTWQIDGNSKFENNATNFNWNNIAKLTYGRSKVGDADDIKAADELRVESVYTQKLGVYVNPYAAFTGQTQLTAGFELTTDDNGVTTQREVSKFLNPGYFTESFGLGYQPRENLKTRAGLAFKQTVAGEEYGFADDVETLDEIETLRSEVGLESVTDFNQKLSETTLYTTQLALFTAFDGGDAVDVRWENILSGQLAKYVVVNLKVNLLYDKDIDIKRQLQQVFTLGLTYTFL